MSETSGGAPDQTATRVTEDQLLLQAVAVLRRRYEEGGRYHELPPFAAAELGDALAGLAAAEQAGQELSNQVDRAEAVALAHRLIDDDHPELSPIWPGSPA